MRASAIGCAASEQQTSFALIWNDLIFSAVIHMSTLVEMFCFVMSSSETFVALRFAFNCDWNVSLGWFIIDVSLG